MERLPQGVYTAEFRAEAVKLVLAQKMSVAGAAKRLSVPKRSLNNWVVAARAGQCWPTLARTGVRPPRPRWHWSGCAKN